MTRQPIHFTRKDVAHAHKAWSASCGPYALAAVMGMTLDEVHPHFPHFAGTTNPTMMFAALNSIGRHWTWTSNMVDDKRPDYPTYGLARIQWEGPWMQPTVSFSARDRYTHWVGMHTQNGGIITVWDVNAMTDEGGDGWLIGRDWERTIAPALTAEIRLATGGWHVTHAIEVIPLAGVARSEEHPVTSASMTNEEIAKARGRVERFGIAVRLLRDATPFDLAAFLECAKGVSTDLDSLLVMLQQRTKERDGAVRRAERAEALHASACSEWDRIEAKLDGRCAVLEIDAPAEEPTRTYCDDDGEICEVCQRPLPRGTDIAEFTENDGHGLIKRVVMHYGPCSPR